MNPLYLTEADVVATLRMTDALRLVREAALALAEGKAENRPRQRAWTGKTVIQVLAAAYDGRLGHKTYTVSPARGARFWHTMFDESGEMLSIIEADALGQIRTGAASGVATQVLARDDARTLAVIGSGWQARSQLEAVVTVRPIERVRVYARNRERLEAFCAEMSARVHRPVEPAASGREAVEGADVVCTMTSARTPVLHGSWLEKGAHVNAAGSNRANAQEIDVETVLRSSVVAVEDLAQAKVESGDLRSANETQDWNWQQATLLSDVIAGHALGRTSDDQITLFESLGIGLWDLAVASHVYDACVAGGRGTRLPIPS